VRARRLGVFGGTFDPLHHAHLIVAAEAFEALDLDLLLFVPAADPPHKRGSVVASAEQRLRMLTAGIQGDPRFRVDDLELRRSGPSYTVDTLRALRERDQEADLYFLLGLDQYRQFEGWHRPDEILGLARLAVLARSGERGGGIREDHGIEVPVSRIDLSATAIRERIGSGLSARYFVPEAVLDVIDRETIYR
jgi:nicotinate-nucleotide adenylyltransferase